MANIFPAMIQSILFFVVQFWATESETNHSGFDWFKKKRKKNPGNSLKPTSILGAVAQLGAVDTAGH